MARVVPLVLLFCLTLFSAGVDPFTGTWKLDESKVKPAANALALQSLRIDADQSRVTIFYQGTGDKGAPREWKVAADFGGNDSGVLGSQEFDSVKCWRPDPHTILLKLSRQAQSVGWETLEAQKNGKTLRVTRAVPDANGKEVKTILWFDKQ